MAGDPESPLTDDCCSTSLPAKRPHTEMTTNRPMVESGGSGLVSKIFTGQAIAEQFSMKIPNSKTGLIIGTGGKTIKSMQSISGANIRISPWHLFSGVSPTERTVHIEGTKRQIEIAKQLVNRVISEFLPPTQPSCGPIQGQLLPPSQAFYEAKEQVRSIKCPQDLIRFYQRILKKLEPTNIFFRSQVSRCFWDCLSLRHKNILRPDILDLDENKVTVSFDDYDCTLEEILDKPTFFWEYEDGVVVGITPFFVKLLRDLVEAVFYLKDQWICHAHISVQSIVFKVDDGTNINAKLKNFEFAKYGVLLRQFRNLLIRVNDERHEHNKVDLMWAFLKFEKLYPNLLCEWYGYKNKIRRVVLLYV